MTDLFEPLRLARGPALRNRFMLAPLTNCQSHDDGRLSDEEFRWLTLRAQGGFGLTMTCASHVQAAGRGFPGQLGVFSDAHVEGLSRLAAGIRDAGSLPFIQLHHAGMRAPPALSGTQPVCPSDDAAAGARALTLGEVERVTQDFVDAAVRADRAGFKAGQSYMGLCPFHSEKAPSFTVSPDKQIFYCFGCGAGGNIFSFLMKRDGTSFAQAARALARRCGVDLPERPLSTQDKKRISEQETLLAVNRAAADFFHQTLLRQDAGKKGLDYLERRGLTAATIKAFQLGYAPQGWERLLGAMSRKNYSPALLEKAGLVVMRKEGSGFYDRFRHRLIHRHIQHF